MLLSDIHKEIISFLFLKQGDINEHLKTLSRKYQIDIRIIEETEEEKFFVREMKLPTNRIRIKIKDRIFIYEEGVGNEFSQVI